MIALASPDLEPLRMKWVGPVAEFLTDDTEQIDLEGAIRSGKTTVALWKVLGSCLTHPGMNWLICRYSDELTNTILRPRWEEICFEAGVPLDWVASGRYFKLPNGSRVYCFGIKAQSLTERYSKFRGVTLAGIYNDQTEELPFDVYEELVGRLSQIGYPHQILLTPNPMEEDSWMAVAFPEDNHIRHRKYFRVSIYDNAHNLDEDTIQRQERMYPAGHAKHRPMLLGQRGMNVIGDPVYGALDPGEPDTAAFQRARHERPLDLDPDLPLYELIDYGKKHPCVIWEQYTPWGDLRILGGVMGHHMYLEDFAPIIQQYRQRWFADALEVVTGCDPAGSHNNSQGLRQNGVSVLKDHGFSPNWKGDANSPAVRLAMIERIAGHMRRRSPQGESFGIDRERWYRVSANRAVQHRFLADGCEAGYVWDEHLISVGSKQMRRPKKEGGCEHGQNCMEYGEQLFGGVQPTREQSARHATAVRSREQRHAQRDYDPYDMRMKRPRMGRGGY